MFRSIASSSWKSGIRPIPGVVVDAVRCAKVALDRSLGGALIGPSSYLMKSPPQQFSDHEARARTEAFIRDEEYEAGKISARLAKAR
jgi:hypothetical protein